ncbi:MAG: hypothetical protein HC842_04065 [Cytophagales bacterium]|nr:hypothetical protein [Cytophagales bacterium]
MMKLSIAIILISLLSNGLFKREKLPELNQKIVDYVATVIGTQVDRGECWDLAAAALTYSGAYFDRSTEKAVLIYGRRVDPKKEPVLPGDLMQLENVVLQYTKGNASYTEQMAHHTAIIYQVKENGELELAHQNTGFWGRKVGLSAFDLHHLKKGKVYIYRPVSSKP